MLDKTFDSAQLESEIANLWEEKGNFLASSGSKEGEGCYSLVMPPPNVTGSLHVGHALNGTIQDILARFERMRGKDVLWQPGLDHAGIATQMVVERKLAAEGGLDRRTLGREKFIEKVWEWKEESGGSIVSQFRRLGVSCDWSRERFTMDEDSCKAVNKAFVTLYKDGLIYKNKRLVNWDPALLTAISDLEVEVKEVKGSLWYIRYPLADKAFNPEDSSTYVVIATTRPETLLGDSGLAVNPKDDRYADLVGKNAILPLVGRELPVVADDYVSVDAGSGVVKMTPAHDFNDFEVGERHNLRLINILTKKACLSLVDNEDFLVGLQLTDKLQELIDTLEGQTTSKARELLIAALDKEGYLEKIEEHVHNVPHGDRSGAVIEPYLTDQWYLNTEVLSKKALEAVQTGDTKIIPSAWDKTYYNWLNDIRPWCISRQLWWGHQIPAWYGPDGKFFVESTEADAKAAALKHYGEETTLVRDEDVLDTWFSSSLWPFLTLGWPKETKELEKYYPTSILVTGFDILFFWVARMMMMGLYFMGEVPFKDVYLHPLVRDKHGSKMSKSKGNVIDPLELINSYGADSLRFTLAIMSVQGRDVRLEESRVEGYRNFTTKLWNATRFAEMNNVFTVENFSPNECKLEVNRWILTSLTKTIKLVEKSLEAYKFNEASLALYRFVWHNLCDWYVELAKPTLMGEDAAAREEVAGCLRFCLEEVYKLLHPFMPFITEFLWQNTASEGKDREQNLAVTSWPNFDFSDKEAEDNLEYLISLITAIRSARSQMNVPASAKVPLWVLKPTAELQDFLLRYDSLLKRLARISEVEVKDEPAEQSLQIVVEGTNYSILVSDFIDIAAEKLRIEKKLNKLLDDQNKIKAKLDNPKFVNNAAASVVEQERERFSSLDSEIAALNLALNSLS